MNLKEIREIAESEIDDEQKAIAKEIIKERLLEIRALKALLKKAEAKLDEILNMDIDDVSLL